MDKVLSSPATLAFVGDAYFGLLVRTKLAEIERPIGELHRLSVTLVNANAQEKGFLAIENMLSEEEFSFFKKGRNIHTKNTPKNSSVATYHTATGLESLFGFLKLSGREERAKELFSVIWDNVFEI